MKKFIFLFTPSFIFLLLLSVSKTYSLFSDSAVSARNTFTASTEFPTATPTPEGIANHIVISEVQIDGGTGSGGANDHDFIELYNPTSTAINLSGHRLLKRAGGSNPSDELIYQWGSDTFIDAYSYLLWASGSDETYPSSINADIQSNDTLGANNSIALKQSVSGPIIDALSWSSAVGSFSEGNRFSPNPGDNESMERKALSTSSAASMQTGTDINKGNGYDTNNNDTDFILRSLSQPQNSSTSEQL